MIAAWKEGLELRLCAMHMYFHATALSLADRGHSPPELRKCCPSRLCPEPHQTTPREASADLHTECSWREGRGEGKGGRLRDRYGKLRCTHMYNQPLSHLGRSATGIPASCSSGSGALADEQEKELLYRRPGRNRLVCSCTLFGTT